jgi:anti-anti-sigma regulatory factor
MTDLQRIAEPVIVFLPDEIDMNNAGSVYHQIADLTSTRFCDSSGIRQIALAHHHAASLGTQLRLAVAPGGVRRVLEKMELEHVLVLYPTVAAALAADRIEG